MRLKRILCRCFFKLGLFKEKYSLKRCKYCGMFYVNIEDSTRDEIMDIVKADPIFVMNINRKNDSIMIAIIT